ncbi:hypothetical protein [Dactylosporangium maewongense]|uniref:hypothetical protein n=1 Tax=Dactylosporangium maewongense TaxID=634393 RepID=UPI0031DF4CFE
MDAHTLTGQLRRGRGLGLRRALSDGGAEAVEAVYGCCVDDPRDDRSTEERSWYLLRLARALRLDSAPIAAHLLAPVAETDEDDCRIGLAADVLAGLARDGDPRALQALRAYVVEGRYWSRALDAMWEEGGDAMCEGLAPAVLARADDDELRFHVEIDDGPWSAWAAGEPRIRALLDAESPRSGGGGAWWPLRELPDARLMALVEADGPAARTQAMRELGRRGDPVLLDLAEDPAMRNVAGGVPGLWAVLDRLGAGALDRARGWAASDDPDLAGQGVRVLAEHGTAQDVPALLADLTAMAEQREWCGAETPARGLGRLGAAEAVPTLRFLWKETTHSYARGDYLAGLLGAAGAGAAELLVEAADDCEERVREYTSGTAQS